LSTAAPPTLRVEGVAVTVKEARFWDEGLAQPVIKIKTKKPHRSPEQTRALGEIRMNRLVGWKIQSIAAWGKWPFQRRERAIASLRYGVPLAYISCLCWSYYRGCPNLPQSHRLGIT
jgi:hypothetical protein